MAQYHASFVFIATGTRAEIFKGRNGTWGGGGGGPDVGRGVDGLGGGLTKTL